MIVEGTGSNGLRNKRLRFMNLFGISVEYGLKLRHTGAKSIETSLEATVVIQA